VRNVTKIELTEKELKNISKLADLIDLISDLACGEMHCGKLIARAEDENTKKLWSNMKKELRLMRTRKMREIFPHTLEGKVQERDDWCLSKHVIRAYNEFTELGDKELSSGDVDKAIEDFNSSWECIKIIMLIKRLIEEESKIKKRR